MEQGMGSTEVPWDASGGAVGWVEQEIGGVEGGRAPWGGWSKGCQWVDGCHGHWPALKATLTEVSR